MRLSEQIIESVTLRDKPFKLTDGQGMYLLVMPNGAKWWRFKYYIAGREKQISLGTYPEIPLDEARLRREQARHQVAIGIDPSEQRKMERAAEKADIARLSTGMRFSLDNEGSLCLIRGKRLFPLDAAETAALRDFLLATREVVPRTINHAAN